MLYDFIPTSLRPPSTPFSSLLALGFILALTYSCHISVLAPQALDIAERTELIVSRTTPAAFATFLRLRLASAIEGCQTWEKPLFWLVLDLQLKWRLRLINEKVSAG